MGEITGGVDFFEKAKGCAKGCEGTGDNDRNVFSLISDNYR
jgi:hypothetical protein